MTGKLNKQQWKANPAKSKHIHRPVHALKKKMKTSKSKIKLTDRKW
jgi:hypothetical protein